LGEVDIREEGRGGSRATHEHERAIQARCAGTEGLDAGEPWSVFILYQPRRLSLAWDGIGTPHPEEQFPRGDGLQLGRAQGLGGQERDALYAVEVAVEYAADGAVGPGDGPQHAPLLGERGTAAVPSDGVGNGDRECARRRELQESIFWKRGVRVSPGGAGGDLHKTGLEGACSSKKALFLFTEAEGAHGDNTLRGK